MRLDDDDVATVTAWASDDRRDRIVGLCLVPVMPFVWWWLVAELTAVDFFCLEMLIGPVAVVGTLYALAAIVDVFRGRSTPSRILDGAEPTVRYAAVVHRDDGHPPYTLSVRIDVPADDPRRYVHLTAVQGLEVGQRLVAMGWDGTGAPFREGMLLATETGRRLWTREDLHVSECHEYDPGS